MKLRHLLCTAAACMAMAGTAMAQIVSYPVNNENGCTTGAPVVVSGITASQLCRGAGINFNTAGNSYNSTGFVAPGGTEATAIAQNEYLEFTVTPSAGFKVTLTDIVVNVQRSNTGPVSCTLRSSADGFATQLGATASVPTSAANRTFDFADFDTCTPVTFRVYAFGGSGTAGTFRVQGPSNAIVVNGSAVTGTCGAAVTGACCVGGVCDSTVTEVECNLLGGFWGGDGTSCPGFVCPAVGACCFADGTCDVLTNAECTTQSGTYQGDTTGCNPNLCPQPVGGCCISGVCFGTNVTQADCIGSSGTWLGANVSCQPGVNCIEPQAACCLPDGSCVLATATSCAGQGGIGIPSQSSCATIVCTYACCFTDGSCTVTSLSECSSLGGLQTANLSRTCSPNACLQPTALGACCVLDVCTAGQSFADCNTAGGIWLGKGTTCTASVCNQASAPTLVAKYDFDVNRQATSFTIVTDAAPALGDAFNPVQRYRASPEPVAFALLDDSVFLFPFVDAANPGDQTGVIAESKVDTAFGVTDTFDVAITDAAREAVATWDFNVSGRTNLSFNLDIAGQGNFESSTGVVDRFIITYQLDAGAEMTVFDARADEAVDATVTFASGMMFTIPDPLRDTVSGNLLSNVFANYNFAVPGTGSSLKVRLKANTDGGDEAFVIDNVMVMADAVDVTPTPCEIADFDNANGVDPVDLFAFLDAWFAGLATADLFDPINGTPDVTDLFDYLDLWFFWQGTNPCP